MKHHTAIGINPEEEEEEEPIMMSESQVLFVVYQRQEGVVIKRELGLLQSGKVVYLKKKGSSLSLSLSLSQGTEDRQQLGKPIGARLRS